MWKAALAGTAALAIVSSSLVYAQDRGRGGAERFQPNIDDMRAFADARLAALHAGLGLTADQERNWPAFEQASREMAKLRLDRISSAIRERRDQEPQSNDPAARMHQRANNLTEQGAALKKVADAFDPLYKSLDDAQKRRFAVLERFIGRGEQRLREERFRDGRGPGGGPGFPSRGRRTDYLPQAPQGGEERL